MTLDDAGRVDAQLDLTSRSNQRDKERKARSILWEERPHALQSVLMCMGNVRQRRGLQVLLKAILSSQTEGDENTAWGRRRLQTLYDIR